MYNVSPETTQEYIRIYDSLCSETEDMNDDILTELMEDFVNAALQYAEMREYWLTFSREEKRDKDPLRTARHNSLIDSINILDRYIRKQKGLTQECSWRAMLGDPQEDPAARKKIGDFACYAAYVYGINAR